MSRTFTATNSTRIDTTPGGMNTNWSYGSIAAIFRRGTLTTGTAYQAILSSELTGAVIGFDFTFDTSDKLDLLIGGVHSNTNFNSFTSSTDWLFVLVSKATGTVTPVFHVFNYTTAAWAHLAGNTTQADMGATATINFHIGSYLAGVADFINADIEMAGVYKAWAPSNLEVEQSGMHLSKLAWIDVTSRATNSWVARLDQAVSGDPVYDLTGGGGNESAVSATVPTIGGAVPNFGWGGPVIMPNPSAAVVYSPNRSLYRYKMAMQRAATW